VEWGIYSDTAIQKMKDVQAEWSGFNPESKTASLTITTYHNDVYGSQASYDKNAAMQKAKNDTSYGDLSAEEKALKHQSSGGAGGGSGGGPGGANGLDFIVPGGYPNDSYPFRAQSGEHVQVTPAGQTGGGFSDSQMSSLTKAIVMGIMTATAKKG
jgi:hypothetical protein